MIVFASVLLWDVLRADRDTTPAVHWYSGAALPVLLYYRMHRLCDKVDEACIFLTLPGQSSDSGGGSIKQQCKKKKRMCKDISSAHTRFVVHLCISLYLSINCISMHVLSTVKTRWNVSFAYRLLIYSISTHYVRTQMNGTIRQWEDSSVHTVNIMWISCSVLYNDDLSFALEPVCRAYTLAPNHMTKTTLVSLLSEWHVGDEYIWIN